MNSVPPPPASGGPQPQPLAPDSRNWALAAHLSAFAAVIIPLPFLGPLIVWLIRRDVDPYSAEHAKEALNFNITATIAYIVSIILIFVVVGFLLLLAVAIVWLVLVIMAAVKASNGESYRYPLTIRFVT